MSSRRGRQSMACPGCGGRSNRVYDSRATRGHTAVRRRRECRGCRHRWTTLELEIAIPPGRQVADVEGRLDAEVRNEAAVAMEGIRDLADRLARNFRHPSESEFVPDEGSEPR